MNLNGEWKILPSVFFHHSETNGEEYIFDGINVFLIINFSNQKNLRHSAPAFVLRIIFSDAY